MSSIIYWYGRLKLNPPDIIGNWNWASDLSIYVYDMIAWSVMTYILHFISYCHIFTCLYV